LYSKKKKLNAVVLSHIYQVELAGMAGRIKAMRQALYEELQRRKAPGDWSFILRQIGMFSYTGLTREQVSTGKLDILGSLELF
jgi:aspartate aminotransferase